MFKNALKIRKNMGITLIALVITIIVLLILAGVSITMLTGENGILSHSKEAQEKYNESAAKERLELELANLATNKFLDDEYNQDNYIDFYLQERGFVVNGNIVIVDNWQFQIDRTVPKIAMSLGKGIVNDEIKLTVTQTVASNYTKSTINIIIDFPNELKEIKIGSENIDIPQIENGNYSVKKDILENGNYTIYVKDMNGGYKISNIVISEISENVEIYTAEDLAKFRDKVNNGATFEGKTITLTDNIDLSIICGEGIGNWNSIGTGENSFKGTFNGNNFEIKGLHFNDNSISNIALFYTIEDATIQNVNLSNINISGNTYLAGIAINSNNSYIKNCTVSGTIQGNSYCSGIVANNSASSTIELCSNEINVSITNAYAAGIANTNNGTIKKCKNIGNHQATKANSHSGVAGIASNNNFLIQECYNSGTLVGGGSAVGGISSFNIGTIENCYNTGNITGGNLDNLSMLGGLSAYNGVLGTPKGTIKHCYNIGTLTTTSGISHRGGISGYQRAIINYSYCLNNLELYSMYDNTQSCTNSSTKTDNELKKVSTDTTSIIYIMNNTQNKEIWTNDVQEKDKTWKYNNGFPILKWQVENN